MDASAVEDGYQAEWDPEYELPIIETRPRLARWWPDAVKADKSLMLRAVAINGLVLEYAADSLKDDKEVVLAALESKWGALCFASDALQCDTEVVQYVVDWTIHAVDLAPMAIRNDKSFIMRAMEQGWEAFRYAGPQLRLDSDIVSKAFCKLREAAEDDYYRPAFIHNMFLDFQLTDVIGRFHIKDLERSSPLCAFECLAAQRPDEASEFIQNFVEKQFLPVTDVELYLIVLKPFSGHIACAILDKGFSLTKTLKRYVSAKLKEMLEETDHLEVQFLVGSELLEDDSCVNSWPGVQAGGQLNVVDIVVGRPEPDDD